MYDHRRKVHRRLRCNFANSCWAVALFAVGIDTRNWAAWPQLAVQITRVLSGALPNEPPPKWTDFRALFAIPYSALRTSPCFSQVSDCLTLSRQYWLLRREKIAYEKLIDQHLCKFLYSNVYLVYSLLWKILCHAVQEVTISFGTL